MRALSRSILGTLVSILLASAATSGDATAQIEFDSKWTVSGAREVALDSHCNVYVTNASSVAKYSPDGTFILSWPGPSFPIGIAVDGLDRVWVVGFSGNKIERFSSTGALQGSWGSAGSGPGQFSSPVSVAIDSSNNVYVTDGGNNRVQKFNSSGGYVAEWGSTGSLTGEFINPWGIAVDSADNIYVADGGNSRIQKFDSSGTFLLTWGSSGTGDGQFQIPRDIVVGGPDLVYVSELNGDRIQKFTTTGTFKAKFGGPGSLDGQFNDPEGLAADGSGDLDVGDRVNNRVQKLVDKQTQLITFIQKWGSLGTGDGQFNQPYGVVIHHGSGNIYVTEFVNHRIQKFDASGVFIKKWGRNGGDGTFGTGDGEFNTPVGIAVDVAGNVYVADATNNRVQVFDSDGVFLRKWGVGDFPFGIAVDSSGNVYVSRHTSNQIRRYNFDGSVILAQWGTTGGGNGQFQNPWMIALDKAENLFVADTFNHRIQKFTNTGVFITKWGSMGTGDGQFNQPRDIAVSSTGHVYVSDGQNNRVQKFTSTGTFVHKWGSNGSGDGQFKEPQGLAVDVSDNIYVAERGINHRIQKFVDGAECFLFLGLGSANWQIMPKDYLLVDRIAFVWPVLIRSVPTIDIPNHPAFKGLNLFFQVALLNEKVYPKDPLKMSNGLKVTIGASELEYGQHSGLRLWAPSPARIGKPFKIAFKSR